MTARKTKTRKKTTRSRTTAQRARRAIEDGLRDLERRLPANLRGPVRELRANLASLWRQIEKARQDREERWKKMETQLRRDMAQLLRRLERMVSPAGTSRGGAARKSGTRKKAARRKKR